MAHVPVRQQTPAHKDAFCEHLCPLRGSNVVSGLLASPASFMGSLRGGVLKTAWET